jgi:hypothetical protein
MRATCGKEIYVGDLIPWIDCCTLAGAARSRTRNGTETAMSNHTGHEVHDGYCYTEQVWIESEEEFRSRYVGAAQVAAERAERTAADTLAEMGAEHKAELARDAAAGHITWAELDRQARAARQAEEEFRYARAELDLARERLGELRARVSDAESWVRVSERALARATSEFYRTQAPGACVNGYHVPEPHAWIRTCAEGPAAR